MRFCRAEVAAFLTADRAASRSRTCRTEIAERLTLSLHTVERHFQNIYLTLGLTGRYLFSATYASATIARPTDPARLPARMWD